MCGRVFSLAQNLLAAAAVQQRGIPSKVVIKHPVYGIAVEIDNPKITLLNTTIFQLFSCMLDGYGRGCVRVVARHSHHVRGGGRCRRLSPQARLLPVDIALMVAQSVNYERLRVRLCYVYNTYLREIYYGRGDDRLQDQRLREDEYLQVCAVWRVVAVCCIVLWRGVIAVVCMCARRLMLSP
jgi:hypothetical protein